MELTSLTVLVDILDAGNLSQAARNLKMTRANVSYHLSQLEKAGGLQRVRRTTRRIEATEAGRKLCQHGRAIRDELVSEVWPLLEAGTIAPVIHDIIDFDHVAEGHRLMESSNHIGKIVMRVS